MDDDLPMDTSRDVFYFNEGALAYAGYYLHAEDNPLHAHSFVEIAFAVGGAGTHHCVAGRRELRAGMSSCFGPASGTGTNSASGWSCTTAGALYLRSIPASTGDIKLITVIGAVGVLLGLLAGALMKVRLTEDGSLVTVTGASYAAV